MKKYSFIFLLSLVSFTVISQNFKLNSLSENTKVLDFDSLDFNQNKLKVDFTDPDVNIGEYYSAYWTLKQNELTDRWTGLLLLSVGIFGLQQFSFEDEKSLFIASVGFAAIGVGFNISSLSNKIKAFDVKIDLGRKLPNEYFQLNL